MQFRPADIAKECNVSVGTVRNWCTDYAEFLSAGANPTDGDRKLSERDLEVCRYIAQLRKEGMSKPQIALRLRETSFGTVESTEKPTEAPQSPQSSLQTALEASPALQQRQGGAIVPKVDAEFVTSIERRFEALERSASEAKQEQRAAWWYIALGIIIGLGLAAVFEMAALVASRR